MERVEPVLAAPHHLLATLLLCNAGAMEALPLFLDRLLNPVAAILLSGGRSRPSAGAPALCSVLAVELHCSCAAAPLLREGRAAPAPPAGLWRRGAAPASERCAGLPTCPRSRRKLVPVAANLAHLCGTQRFRPTPLCWPAVSAILVFGEIIPQVGTGWASPLIQAVNTAVPGSDVCMLPACGDGRGGGRGGGPYSPALYVCQACPRSLVARPERWPIHLPAGGVQAVWTAGGSSPPAAVGCAALRSGLRRSCRGATPPGSLAEPTTPAQAARTGMSHPAAPTPC